MAVNRVLFLFVWMFLLATEAGAVEVQSWTAPSGARVLFAEAREIPMAAMRISFDAGSARDLKGLDGLASFTVAMLDEGAGGMSADVFAERFDGLGAGFSLFVDTDHAGVQIQSLRDPDLRRQAAELTATMLARPDFPKEAFQRERGRMLVAFRERDEDPGSVAERAFQHLLYGDHPYGHPVSGDKDSIERMSISALRHFHKKYFTARNAVVSVVGDLSREEAEAWVDMVLDALPAGEKAKPLPEVERKSANPGKWFVEMPVNQSHILIGQPAMARSDAEYFPALVGNYTLGGGGFSSRLMHEVREKRGLSYSVYSYFDARKVAGPFAAGAQTKTEQAGEAIAVMEEVIGDYLARGPSAEEMQLAHSNLSGSFPLRINSNAKILSYLNYMGEHNLPMDYLDRFQEIVVAVDGETAREAMDEALDLDGLTVLVVGKDKPAGDYQDYR